MQASCEIEPNVIRQRVVPHVKLDTRTRIGRRVGELVADFTEALRATTTISPALAQKIADAATLKVIAETAHADYFKGRRASGRVTLARLVHVERRAAAAIRALALPDQAHIAVDDARSRSASKAPALDSLGHGLG